MTRQRGVKKLRERSAGPYVILTYNVEADYARSRKYIVRRCRTPSGKIGHRQVYNRPNVKFGELMQLMRAFFRIERELVAEQCGLTWESVTLDDHDSCQDPTLVEVAYNITPGVLQRKIQEMLEEERGSE